VRVPEPPRIGILTVSDRASRGEYPDESGPAVRAALDELLISAWISVEHLVPDDAGQIESALIDLIDVHRCVLVLTTGGTGPAMRDVTPDATRAVCGRELPGLGEAMRAASGGRVPTAMLSRQTAAIRGTSLIVNLPGKPAGATECLNAVLPAIIHCVALLTSERLTPVARPPDPHV
jgi:molybdopterin adenylyltransferase